MYIQTKKGREQIPFITCFAYFTQVSNGARFSPGMGTCLSLGVQVLRDPSWITDSWSSHRFNAGGTEPMLKDWALVFGVDDEAGLEAVRAIRAWRGWPRDFRMDVVGYSSGQKRFHIEGKDIDKHYKIFWNY